MAIQISIDRNVVNALSLEMLRNKFLPALRQNKIIVHLMDTFLGELFSDDNSGRRARHADIFQKIFNGKIILSLPQLISSELQGKNELFYNNKIEARIRRVLDYIAQRKLSIKARQQKIKEARRFYNEDLKNRQEDKLITLKSYIKKKLEDKEIDKELLKQSKKATFEEYYAGCPNEWKWRKLKRFLEVNKISYKGDISQYLDNKNYPCSNFWLRSWFGYHYYTVQRGQFTLRKNDASDLDYIVSAYYLDYFITNDEALRNIGNLVSNSVDKYIAWDDFESRFIK